MNAYVVAGYLVILLSLAAYTWRVLQRSRALARAVAALDEPASSVTEPGPAWP